jgi:hypothetical protein
LIFIFIRSDELNERVLANPREKVRIIREFFAEQRRNGNEKAARKALLVHSIVTARDESPAPEQPPQEGVPGRAVGTKMGATPTPLWKKAGFWAALFPAAPAVLVGYWQFVYKPSHPDDLPHSQLLIYVRNARTQDAVPSAEVSLQTDNGQKDQTTDSLGTALFHITKADGSDWRIYASCSGYEKRNIRVDGSTVGSKVELALAEVAHSTTTVRPLSGVDAIKGTWEVVAVSDVNNSRIQKGTFDFAPQHDKSIVVNASFHADDMDVKASGSATLQSDRLALSFAATNSVGGKWDGQGDFTLVSPGQLSGRIQSKRGDDIPLSLS